MMDAQSVITNRVGLVAAVFAIVILARVIYIFFLSPLRGIPGPILARFTSLWQFLYLRGRPDVQNTLIELHEKHGPIVRVAPNLYSINSPQDIKTIYWNRNFRKSRFYSAAEIPHQPNLFSIKDETEHADRKRRIGSFYTMTSVAHYEPAVDKINKICLKKLEEAVLSGKAIDVPDLMARYAFDVISEISIDTTFDSLGGSAEGEKLYQTGTATNKYITTFGVFPELHEPMYRLAKFLKFTDYAGRPNELAQEQIALKYQSKDNASADPDAPASFLTKLVRAEQAGKLDRQHMLDSIGASFAAGSDTTAITLTAALYYLFHTPQVLASLRQEIDSLAKSGEISDPVTFAEAQKKMPYLQATIQETLRLHPAVGAILPRVVPEGGAEIAGQWFPAGSEVGSSAWVLHHNRATYGPDAHEFRPERYFSSGEYHAPTLFSFGAGSRICLGRNISILEISKVLPQIVRKFDIVFDADDKPWEFDCQFLVWQQYKCRVKTRSQ